MTQGHRGPLLYVNRRSWAVTVVNKAVMERQLALHSTTEAEKQSLGGRGSVRVGVEAALCWSVDRAADVGLAAKRPFHITGPQL